jgi:hypothetical protein
MRSIPAILFFLVFAPPAVPVQNNSNQQGAALRASTQAAAQAASRSSSDADEQQALRDDLKRMHILLGQMQANLAFVDNSPSPLKHQFQLEIEMWRELINQMERRLQARSR